MAVFLESLLQQTAETCGRADHDDEVVDELIKRLDAIPNYMFTILAVRREWSKANRELLVELIRADQEALAWMEQPANREKLIGHWVDITKASRESAAKTYDLYISGPLKGKVFPKDAQVSRSGVEAVIAITKEGGSLKKDVTVEQIVDFSFLEAAGKK